MNQLRVYHGVEALYVTPFRLFTGVLMIIVAKTYADYVAHSEDLLDGSYDGCLYFL